jgi:hypothetical protein
VFELLVTEPPDGNLYPPHFLDIAPYMSENNEEESYLYEIDSIIHYVEPNRVGYVKPNEVGHFTTAIPLDKDYDRWRVWDNEKASEVSRDQLDSQNTHVVFYRKTMKSIKRKKEENTKKKKAATASRKKSKTNLITN